MKPGFEDFLKREQNQSLDTDLDGEIYADQLHSLLQRISPEVESLIPKFSPIKAGNLRPANELVKRTDEETIWDRIHGTFAANVPTSGPPQSKGKRSVPPQIPAARTGIFEGAFQGPKIFRQSIMTQTVRKPDGSYETRRIVRDGDGTVNTTVTKTGADGKSETFSTTENDKKCITASGGKSNTTSVGGMLYSDRNIYVTKDGYAMPKNIW